MAGRGLPLYMNMATVFATWFGAETVLSVSATFVKDGLGGIPADPFGATFCLVFVALFFARAFYRMDLLTIGDFYKKRYGKGVEVLTSLAVTLSYLGWTSRAAHRPGHRLQLPLAGRHLARPGHPHRRGDRPHLHDLRRHVVGGAHGPLPVRGDRAGPHLRGVPGHGHGGRRRARWSPTPPRPASSSSGRRAAARSGGLFVAALDHDGHRLDPAAGRLPARDQRQEREHGGEGLAPGRRWPTSASPSCRSSSPTPRSSSTRRWSSPSCSRKAARCSSSCPTSSSTTCRCSRR